MREILVHAGNLKTGTTAIQAVLNKMRPALALRGIVMPSITATERAHYRLARELRRDADASAQSARMEVLTEIGTLDASVTPLLTAETFVASNPRKMHDFLGNFTDRQPKFLFYARPHNGLLASMYLQLVKTGKYSQAIDDITPQLMRLPPLRFMDVISGYADAFGDEALTVREFSRDRLVAGSIIADFWDAFDLPQDLLQQALAVETIANPTPTVEMAVLLRAWREHLVRALDTQDMGMLNQPVLSLFQSLCKVDLPGCRFHLPVVLQQQMAAQWDGPRRDFAARWFALPPTDEWLNEKIVAPSAAQPLPFEGVEAVANDTVRRMHRLDMPRPAAEIAGFLAALPVETAGGARMVDIAALEARIDAQTAPARPAHTRPDPAGAGAPHRIPSPEPSIQEM